LPRLSPHLAATFLLLLVLPVCAAPAPALKNPSFEEGLNGWNPMPNAPGVLITQDRSKGRTGVGSLKLSGPDGANPWVAQGLGELQPHAVYGAQAWARREAGTGQAAIKLEFFDATDHYLGGYYGLSSTDLGADWTAVAVQAEAPEGAAKAAVLLRLIGPGTIYFDDVTFTMVTPPPALVLSPARLVAPAQAGGSVTVSARLLVEQPTGAPTVLLAGGPLARPVSLVSAVKPGTGGAGLDLALTLPADVKPGAYKLQVTWGPLPAATMDLVLLPSGQHPGGLDAQGRFVRMAGAPPVASSYFPLGLYHVTPADFKPVAAAGFTVVEIAPPAKLEDLQAAASAAQDAGLRLLVPLYPALTDTAAADAAVAMVKALAGSPAIFGWLLADEPELKPAEAAAVPNLYLRVREADNNHPVLLNLGAGADLADWAPLADALLVNLLPVTGTTPDTERPAVAARLAAAASALGPGHHAWLGVIPAGWSGRPPLTTPQARAYLYQLLAAGASGACWFSLREGQWDLTMTALWRDLPHLNAEAGELATALFTGQALTDVEVSSKELTSRAVRSGKQAYVILFNPTAQAVSGYLRMADAVTKAEYLDGGPAPKVTNRTVAIDLPPGSARALRLTLEPAAAPPPAPAPEPEPAPPTPPG
jgi:hypothetical protein